MRAEPAIAAAPRKPRYLELAEDLRARILSGGFPGADQFPTESVLCARYHVSRFTVREALRTLQHEGLIQRRRGSGTVVRPAAARGGALRQPLSSVGELHDAPGTRFVFERAGSVLLPKRLAEEVGVDVAGKWARFRGIRTGEADDRPIAATDAYVHPALTVAADAIDPAGAAIFRQLEMLGSVKVARVTQDIRAVPASAAIAAALGVPRRSACLRIVRRYRDATGRVIEIAASHHPGDRFAYTLHGEVDLSGQG